MRNDLMLNLGVNATFKETVDRAVRFKAIQQLIEKKKERERKELRERLEKMKQTQKKMKKSERPDEMIEQPRTPERVSFMASKAHRTLSKIRELELKIPKIIRRKVKKTDSCNDKANQQQANHTEEKAYSCNEETTQVNHTEEKTHSCESKARHQTNHTEEKTRKQKRVNGKQKNRNERIRKFKQS